MFEGASVLSRMCNENVYTDNVFHILGVGVDVTPRKLRRRREDLETAYEFGGDAWTQQFKHILGNLELPTYEEVCDAFDRLENPEERIVSEFFWFWPTDSDDTTLEDLLSGRKSIAIRKWEQGEYAYGRHRIIAVHNLAVLYHLYAIDAELQAVQEAGNVPKEFYDKMCGYWEKSFDYWERIVDNNEFWAVFAKRVREFDDPRLTDSFVYKFRQEFPIVFDNINARIAAEYAKVEAYGDAKRHVNYMQKTMSGLDDVESSLNILFAPLESKVKHLVDNYDEKIKTSPAEGLNYARTLLNETEEIRQIAIGMLSKNHKIRIGLLSEIARACNRYVVEYGNVTTNWEACLDILNRLKELSCTPELEKIVHSNIAVATNNLEYKNISEMCWFCKTNKADGKYGIKMYGDVRHEWGQIKWRYGTIDIPICNSCREVKSKSDSAKFTAACIVAIIVFVIGCCITPELFICWGFAAAVAGWLATTAVDIWLATVYVGDDGGFDNKCKEYPSVKELLSKGWRFGEKPPDP